MTILLRELKSTLPKPNKIADFTCISKDTVEKVSQSDSVDLHKKTNQLIKEKNIFLGQIGLNDIKILVETATEIPSEIEY